MRGLTILDGGGKGGGGWELDGGVSREWGSWDGGWGPI